MAQDGFVPNEGEKMISEGQASELMHPAEYAKAIPQYASCGSSGKRQAIRQCKLNLTVGYLLLTTQMFLEWNFRRFRSELGAQELAVL